MWTYPEAAKVRLKSHECVSSDTWRRVTRDGARRRNQHSFTMARSALLLTSFIITLDSMIYRITNFSLAGRQNSSLLPTTCDQLSWRRIRLTRSAKAEPLVTHFTPFMHKLAVQSILAVRVGVQAVGCIWTDECELLASSECVERLTLLAFTSSVFLESQSPVATAVNQP